MQLPAQLQITPFIRILPPLAGGILVSEFVEVPVWAVGLICAAIYTAAWILRKSPAAWWYIAGAVFVTGILLGVTRAPRSEMPSGQKLMMAIEVRESPVIRGRWQRTTAQVGYFRLIPNSDSDSVLISDSADGWQTASEKIQFYIDTCQPVSVGEQLTVIGYLNPIDTTSSRYGALMRSRGLIARTYIPATGVIARMPEPSRNLNYYAASVQRAAVERLSRLCIPEKDRNMVTALVAGEKRGLDSGLKNDYSKTGVAHILAVSGLHLGFVLIIANLLFGWVVLLHKGHLAKNILVILALWFYAVVAGLSPSVVRAAIMMSAAQVALGVSIRTDSYNIVLGTATLMLALNPFYLFDISFQLSFLAVLGILFLYPRLYRRRLGANRWTDALWSSILLSLAAQIGVLPLIAYNFGNIPIISLLINPPVIITSFVVISTGLLWLILPISFLNPMCSAIISWTLNLQNTIVSRAAATPVAAIENLTIHKWQVVLAYAILIAICIFIKLRESTNGDKKTKPLRPRKKSRIFAPK